MSVAARPLPLVIIGRTREAALSAVAGLGAGPGMGPLPAASRQGSNGLAARVGHAYLMWGVVPSPLAVKTAENILALYDGEENPPDRVFYACYAGTHSSVLAGSLHVGLLDNCRTVCDLPMFDRRVYADIGVPALVGLDEVGTEVYALGTGWLSRALEEPLCDLIEVASPTARACVCSVRGFLDLAARMGGFASRRCAVVRPGRRLIALSLQRKVPAMRDAVRFCLDLSRRWKDNEGRSKGEVIWVDGSRRWRPRIGRLQGEPGGVPGNRDGRQGCVHQRPDPQG